MLLKVPHDTLGNVTLPGIVPKLSQTPGRVRTSGGAVGRDTESVLTELAGLSAEDIERLRAEGEFVLVLHPLAAAASGLAEAERVLDLLLAELPIKSAVRLAAQISGAPRNALYALALQKKPNASSD